MSDLFGNHMFSHKAAHLKTPQELAKTTCCLIKRQFHVLYVQKNMPIPWDTRKAFKIHVMIKITELSLIKQQT